MDHLKNILPETCYSYNPLPMNEIRSAFERNDTIVGFVESISQEKKELSVRLNDEIVATIPYEEATIYPLTYSENNPNFVYPLQLGCLKEKTICAKVKSISDDNKIVLSRKANMLEAYEIIRYRQSLPFKVTGTRTKFVLGDIGYGIQAKLGRADICKSRIRSAAEVFSKGDSIIVKLLSFDESKRAIVSYKDTFPPYNPNEYKIGDTISGTITGLVGNNFEGFYVNIFPQVCGILDYRSWHPIFQYGDKVECVIKGISDKGLHLRFMKFVDK